MVWTGGPVSRCVAGAVGWSAARGLGGRMMAADRLDDQRPQRLGQVVAHVGEHEQVGAGDQLGRALAARRSG